MHTIISELTVMKKFNSKEIKPDPRDKFQKKTCTKHCNERLSNRKFTWNYS